jgi:bifunctional non-homologous end joining protein LigD
MPAKPRRNASTSTPDAARVRITHPERVVFPGTTFTKGDVAAYYLAVMPKLLPEIARRPLSIIRCPDGAGSACFFQKHHADTLGGAVKSVGLREKGGTTGRYLYVDDARAVLELVQMNALEFHPWGSRVDEPDQPDRLVFDLDPAPGIAWNPLVDAANDVRAALRALGLESFARLSGGKGLHVVVPIRRGPDWSVAKAFCERVAVAMSNAQPGKYLSHASKADREGRIFIDWLRNARGATSVASWSLRARSGAPVAVPIAWSELSRMKGPAAFDIVAAMKRATSERADPWPGFDALRQSLPKDASSAGAPRRPVASPANATKANNAASAASATKRVAQRKKSASKANVTRAKASGETRASPRKRTAPAKQKPTKNAIPRASR